MKMLTWMKSTLSEICSIAPTFANDTFLLDSSIDIYGVTAFSGKLDSSLETNGG